MDQSLSDGSELTFFDTSPGSFAWTPEQRTRVEQSRQQTGSLFLDDLISIAAVDGSLYPPKDVLALRKLLSAIRSSSFDTLKKNCLVYYLVRDTQDDNRANSFASSKLIPSQFVNLTTGYWHLDNNNYELAVSLLSSISVKPDFTSKILATLAKAESTASSSRLVLHFIRFARPPIETAEDVHIKLDALSQTSIREAWMYMRTFDEGDFRAGLIGRVFEYCLTPKPKPAPLQTLLAFPFTPFEDQTLSSLCLSPPKLSAPSLNVLFDLANVRLVSQGRFAEAIKLDRAIGAKGAAADKRRATILGLVRLLPEVQRRILELEMDETGGDDVMAVDQAPKGKGKAQKGVNGQAAPSAEDVDMSAGPSASRLPASTSAGSTSQMSISSSNGSNLNLPLSASQVLRTSSSQLAIHRAFIAPAPPASSASPRPTQTLAHSSSFGNGASTSTPGRQQPSSTAFSFQPPANVSSPRPLAFGDLNKSLFASKPASPAPGTPKTATGPSFGRAQSPFGPSASAVRPAEASPAGARPSFAQTQASALGSSQAARGASPFAQAAQKASALQRSAAAAAAPRGAAGSKRLAFRGGESTSASTTVKSKKHDDEQEEDDRRSGPTASSSSKARQQDVDMDDDAEPSSARRDRQEEDLTVSQLDHRPRATRRQAPAAVSASASASTTTTKRKAATSTRQRPAEETRSPSPPPAPKPTRSSHRRTASQVSNPAASVPAPTRASSRAAKPAATAPTPAPAPAPRATRASKPKTTSSKELHIPGAFDAAPSEADEADDVVSSPPPKATAKRAAPGSSRPKTRATSVLSDMGDEEGARTPPRRTTRGSVRGTVSPEAEKEKKVVRRSTRRA